MNHIQKFNRALLKAIRYNKISIRDKNQGAIRQASVKFSFTHDGKINYYSLTSERTAKDLELFGHPEKLELNLYSWNSGYTSGVQCDLPDGIDPSAIKYIHMASVITDDESMAARQAFCETLNEYAVAMSY